MSEVLGTSEIPPVSPRDNIVDLKKMGRIRYWLSGCWLWARV